MSDNKEEYLQLTGIDIDMQRQIWDARGKGYYGEYLVFCAIMREITGNGKILMNLQLPVETGTTEIDLLLIHETGLYVFEIKHYKGRIYGKADDKRWTQYFPTAPNQSFYNPIIQNRWHIQALRAMFPDTPIYSCIVFTQEQCELAIDREGTDADIVRLNDLGAVLKKRWQEKPVYDMSAIDEMFGRLSEYAPITAPVQVDGTVEAFSAWLQPMVAAISEENKKMEIEREKLEEEKRQSDRVIADTIAAEQEQLKKDRKRLEIQISKGRLMIAVVMAACILLSIAAVSGIQKNYQSELDKFKQNFLHVDEIDNPYIDDLQSYVCIEDAVVEPLTDDAVTFSASVMMTNDIYGIAFTEGGKYIVMTEGGTVIEFDVFGERLKYHSYANSLTGTSQKATLAPLQIYGISDPEEISYIKMTGVELFKTGYPRKVVKADLELELYNKQS